MTSLSFGVRSGLVLLGIACARHPMNPQVKEVEVAPGVTAWLDAPFSVPEGDSVVTSVTLTNRSDTTATLSFSGPNELSAVEFLASDSTGALAWSSLHGLVVPRITHEYAVSPGDTLHFSAVW